MKILLISFKEEIKELLAFHLAPRGFDLINYIDPIKGMDNIEEIDPEIVLFSAEDYPRHWKPFLQYLRSIKNREETVFILMSGKPLDLDEASKAIFLGVNGIISENFNDEIELSHLENLLSRYKLLSDQRLEQRFIPDRCDEIELVFNHPDTMKMVIGSVKNISLSGVSFLPDSPHITAGMEPGLTIPRCSLKLGTNIISFSARILRNNQIIILTFVSISEDDKQIILKYMDLQAKRKLSTILQSAE